MAEKVGNGTHQTPEGAQGPALALSPKTSREAIVFMLKGYGEYPDETRIAFYLETLQSCRAEEIWEAVKDWARRPVDRSAKPGEVREIINQARAQSDRATEAEQRKLIEQAEPTSASKLDEIFAQLLIEQPNNQFLKDRIAERNKLRAMGKALDGQAEVAAMLKGLSRGKALP